MGEAPKLVIKQGDEWGDDFGMDVIDSRRISKDDCQTDINDSKEGMH